MLKFNKGDKIMGRPIGTNNIMRTPEQKEKIVKEYLNGESVTKLNKKYNLSNKIIYKWLDKYNQFGIESLKSKTGKHKNLNAGLHLRKPKSKIEELELEILKKDIEIARLKKGYIVKGVGAEKEYVTTFKKNIK